ISGGVPAGANTPYQAATFMLSTPDSASVGTLGTAGERSLLVIPRTRTRSLFIKLAIEGILMNVKCTSPLCTPAMEGPDPLYGTCVAPMPVTCLNNSLDKCWVLPWPDEEKLSLPGFFLA